MAETIKTRCPNCATILRVPAQIQGDTLRCSKCQTLIRIKKDQSPVNAPVPAPRAPVLAPPPPPPPILDTPPRRSPAPSGLYLTVGLVFVGILLFAGVLGLIFWSSKGDIPILGGGDGVENKEGGAKGNLKGKQAHGKQGGAFARRALILSVHNYLYANPVAAHGGNNSQSVAQLPEVLSKGRLNFPKEQILWVSDRNGQAPQPLLKPVLEKTLESFLGQSRPQDRILVAFIGHAVMLEKKAYLVPLEGNIEEAQTLVPLETVFEKLKACKAQQKVLILDVCHANIRFGQERPGAEAMSPELTEAIALAPEGVEVITSCKNTERSWETDNDPAGIFLSSLSKVLNEGMKGQIQKAADPIPVEKIAKETSLQLSQKSQELGKPQSLHTFGAMSQAEVEEVAEAAPVPKIGGEQPIDKLLVERTANILKEIHLPPVKGDTPDDMFDPGLLGTLCDPKSKAIEDAARAGAAPKDNKAYQFMQKVRIHLWAISGRATTPAEIVPGVQAMIAKKEIRADLNLKLIRGGFRAAEDAVLKRNVEANQRSVALILGLLDEDLSELEALGEEKDQLTPYWRANFDYITAKLEAETSYIWEYESMLGQMRKEAPARDPKIHGGWDLASIPNPQGDSKGKKLAKSSKKAFEALSKQYPNTPWDILARREKGTALGLEWQPVP